MKQYDYLIVGAGLYGAVFAHEAKKAGKRCLVIDKRDHIPVRHLTATEPQRNFNLGSLGQKLPCLIYFCIQVVGVDVR